ncbi:alpha/beta fold hydrolase [Vibrio rotiferianus]
MGRLKLITEALGLNKFHLEGNSMGGYIAGNFAAQYPESIENSSYPLS